MKSTKKIQRVLEDKNTKTAKDLRSTFVLASFGFGRLQLCRKQEWDIPKEDKTLKPTACQPYQYSLTPICDAEDIRTVEDGKHVWRYKGKVLRVLPYEIEDKNGGMWEISPERANIEGYQVE